MLESKEGEAGALNPVEVESIEMFISFLRLLGWPKSAGEIYGLLFVSGRPLAMDEIMRRLDMSLGAASQGLKLLREFGAVRVVYQPKARKDHYVASGELSRFAVSYVEEKILPRMQAASERIRRMQPMIEELAPDARRVAGERVGRLKYWLEKGQEAVPVFTRLLDT